jgi:hypothetical protein
MLAHLKFILGASKEKLGDWQAFGADRTLAFSKFRFRQSVSI